MYHPSEFAILTAFVVCEAHIGSPLVSPLFRERGELWLWVVLWRLDRNINAYSGKILSISFPEVVFVALNKSKHPKHPPKIHPLVIEDKATSLEPPLLTSPPTNPLFPLFVLVSLLPRLLRHYRIIYNGCL